MAFLAGAFFALAGARRGGLSATPLVSLIGLAAVSVSLLDVLVFLGTVILEFVIGLPRSAASASGFSRSSS